MKNFKKTNSLSTYLLLFFLSVSVWIQTPFLVSAAPEEEASFTPAAEERRMLPIQTNLLRSWPAGPIVSAEAAILMETETGTILYAKNIDEKLYPASTTKMLTCLIAAERCSMNEIVNFSYAAVDAVPSDGSNMGMDAGEALTMEECLYGIMVASANEVANAVAEHIAGSLDDFAELMNERAAELGCKNSHFVNANGLYDDDHYTTAYDLAVIARAFFRNDILRHVGNTKTYHFTATATQPDDFYKTNKHKLINGDYSYDGIIGGKTGYTSQAGQTLVTGCEQNGMRLICVVLKEDAPSQFDDTITLFNYGYQNFAKMNIADNDSRHVINQSDFFYTGNDIFGDSSPILSLSTGDHVIVPHLSSFENLVSVVDYNADNLQESEIAEITYYYYDTPVGSGKLIFSSNNVPTYTFSTDGTPLSGRPDNVIFINVKTILVIISAIAATLILILILHSVFSGRQDLRHERMRKRKLRRDKRLKKKERKHYKRWK